MRVNLSLFVLLVITAACFADDAKELPPIKPIARVLPPKGVDIPEEDRTALLKESEYIRHQLLKFSVSKTPPPAIPLPAEQVADLKNDIEIYAKAVRFAVDFDEFYDAKKDVAKAHALLKTATQRWSELQEGKPTWTTQRGLVVRGYRSDIDGSVQPYGLHIPEKLDLTKPVPLLVWLHGRGEKETDLHFIASREKSKGEFAPDWCITLHPYGRGTIGFKFAGEIDVLDAIESVKKRYKIDEDRIALAGFSMGGAGAWHIGAHYADKFCVVHAGAGFVETARYNRLTPDKYPASYEQKLWGWYDVPCYTRNLFNVPVIAYSGENDKQKQAADLMAEAFKAEGRELRHIIGPGVEHKYEAKAKEQVLAEIKAAVDKGRERWPRRVSLQTRSLRYREMHWVRLEHVIEHWKDARIDAALSDKNELVITTANVDSFRIGPLETLATGGNMSVSIDDEMTQVSSDWLCKRGVLFSRKESKWKFNEPGGSEDFARKRIVSVDKGRDAAPVGTVDDAFLSPFIMVLPSGKSREPRVQRWVEFESKRAIERWRALFRGDPRVKRDIDLEREDFDRFNVVFWGDEESNKALERYWGLFSPLETDGFVGLADHRFAAGSYVQVMIYPTAFDHPSWKLPQMNGRYIVLNSGPTFREGHDRTNSQQTPKLPDWAIIGLDKDPDAFAPGEIKAAGFFDENWMVKKEQKK